MTPEVMRGAELLDEVFPGWENDVRPWHIVLSSADMCVLGQISRHRGLGHDYRASMKHLRWKGGRPIRLTHFGFVAGSGNSRAWRQAIRDRRRAAKAKVPNWTTADWTTAA